MKSPRALAPPSRMGSGSGLSGSSCMSSRGSISNDVPESTTLDQSILASAISSGMPTFLLTKGVPIIDRRARKLVSANTLSQVQRNKLPPQSVEYPPEQPACLRGHTPTTIGPSEVRMTPKRSVRGPRGRKNIESGTFNKPGVLDGLSVSPWVVEEEEERAKRVASHKAAISKNPLVFRRKREEGGLLDYAEETHAVKRFLDKIHPIRDESCPPKSGFSYRRVSHETEPPDFYDTSLDSVRPRTVGYSPGHVRALSPTPCLTWGGRESARVNLEWGDGSGGPLGSVRACLRGTARGGGSTIRPNSSCPLPSQRSRFGLAGSTDDFVSNNHPMAGGERSPRNNMGPETGTSSIEVRPMWSRQGLHRSAPDPPSFQSPSLRPFTSASDQLGRPMSQGILSRSTATLKPQQFDTTQRRSEYTCALVCKRQARLSKEAVAVAAAERERDRKKHAAEEREGIEKFEGSLKNILAQKWKYL